MHTLLCRVAATLASLTMAAWSATAQAPTYPALRDSLDPEFQRAVEQGLEAEFGPRPWENVEARRVSAVVVDITELERPRVAAINGDVMMYAASLPKIAILLGAFVMIERGDLELDDGLRASMTRMIRRSSNEDASAVLDRVGFENLAGILQSPRYRLYDPEHGGGLWVGRDYGGGKRWKRDPLNGISHGASAMQVARFYYLLATGRMLAPRLQREMIEILSEPGIKHKFVKGLEAGNPDAAIFRKSGTWQEFHADSAMIRDKDYRYIMVALVQDERGAEDLESFARLVDRAVRMSRERPAD